MDSHAGSLEPLLALAARHEQEGLSDAPWPPHYQKQPGEPARVQPSRRRQPGAKPSGRRQPVHPLVEVARARGKADALDGLERWKARHPDAARHLAAADVLVDAMRGRFSTWTRVRVNLQHVPETLRPAQETLDVDEVGDGWEPGPQPRETSTAAAKRRTPSRARTEP